MRKNFLYKTVAILYFACLACYILFTRTPDYFDSQFIQGTVAETSAKVKLVGYEVDRSIYTIRINDWGAAWMNAGQPVTVIYNPTLPTQASVYSLYTYWFKQNELIFSLLGFVVLFAAAVFINGRQDPFHYAEEQQHKKRKYKD